MRFLVVCMLAMAGWVAAAPGQVDSSNKETPEELQHETESSDNLGPAISELARRKRGSSKANLPYSKYRPSGGMHRYRYPLYRKRSYRPSYDYVDEAAIMPESVENDYFEYDNRRRGPSLFRERGLQQERKKKMFLEDEGYFSDDLVPGGGFSLPTAYGVPLKKKDSVYDIASTPYDLHAIGQMYEMGKRDDDAYDLETFDRFHSVGRKSPPRMVMSPTEQFYDAIDTIKRKKAVFNDRLTNPSDEEKLEHLANLNNYLSSAAASRYLQSYINAQNSMAFKDPMIRRKRDVTPGTSTKNITKSVVLTNATTTRKGSSKASPRHQLTNAMSSDRRKRAFNDYFNWERKALESEYQPEKRNDADDKDLNDFLTREYFKSIARSVGQKKKRMAYAQFEADKRSSSIDEFLENPSMLEYMQSKLREAEKAVAMEAEKELGNGNSDELLSNVVVRLDALERMREALGRLEELQNEETAKHQRTTPSGVSGVAKKRRSSNSSSAASPVAVKAVAPAAPPAKKRSSVDSLKKKKSALGARRIRRMRKEEEDALPALFLGNTREDCPVLDRVILNCMDVSKIVGDEDQAFLGACLRHEICYMCGSSISVTGHECDAILSASLEASCFGNLECLGAAGETFKLLGNADRYDGDGTCTHDPCVRQFLESR